MKASTLRIASASLALALLPILPLAAAEPCDGMTSPAELLKRGIQARVDGTVEAAEDCFRRARRLARDPYSPDGPRASLELARLARDRKNSPSEFEALKTAVEDATEGSKAYYTLELGISYLELGQEAEAENQFDRVGPAVADVLFAAWLVERQNWDSAAERLRSLAAKMPPLGLRSETALALQAFVRARQMFDQPSARAASRESWWKDGWVALEQALRSTPEHGLANAAAGGFLAMPRPTGASVPPLVDTKRAEQAFADASARIELLTVDFGGSDVVSRISPRLEFLQKWARDQLTTMQRRDYFPPSLTVVGRGRASKIATGHDHAWLLIDASDDTSLKRIEIDMKPPWPAAPGPIEMSPDQGAKPYTKLHKIPLPPGAPSVTLELRALDGVGRKSDTVKLTIDRPTTVKRRAFILGIEDYQPPRSVLRGLVRNDVDALYRHLIDPVRGGYRPEDVTVLVNKELDGKTLAKVFEAAPGLDKETEVLVYFSGHGDRQEGNYSCLVSFDGCERLDTILAPFRDAKPGWMTVILDACFAGDPKIPRNFNWGTGERNILAAATEKTTAFMTDGRSLVTSTLLEFLTNDALAQEIDVVRSGRIRAGDLFHAVETTLENYRFQKQDVLQDVWSMGAGGKQTLAWRPPTHVARHILDRIDVESMSLGERQFLKTLIQVVTTPGTSQVKSMVIDLLRDLAHRHIKTEPEAWALLRAMEPFLRRLDPAAFSSDAR